MSKQGINGLLWTLGLLVAGVAGGCAADKPVLTMTSLDGQHAFRQEFTQAYLTRADSGDWDVVLVEDGIEHAPAQQPGSPLVSAPQTPLRQVVHIRVFWRPLKGNNPNDPAATNAAIHWYIMRNAPEGSSDAMLYDGAGFVAVYPQKHSATIDIRTSLLQATFRRGELSDPLGAARLTGSFDADANRGRVRDLLVELKALMVPSDPARSTTDRPPPKSLARP